MAIKRTTIIDLNCFYVLTLFNMIIKLSYLLNESKLYLKLRYMLRRDGI